MAEHEDDLPYKAEYAKSNRSSCKACKSTISKESLRLARMVQSPHFDGKVPMWYHYTCFFKKFTPPSTAKVAGFHALRWEDQEKIKNNISEDVKSGGKKKGGPSSGAEVQMKENLQVEYAKSNRSTCRLCKEKIDKGVVRVGIFPEDFEGPVPIPEWHHFECFKDNLVKLDMGEVEADTIPGFKQLQKADKEALVAALGSATAALRKKRSAASREEVDGPPKKRSKEEAKEMKQLKEQSQQLWTIRDMLSREMSSTALKQMLSHNNQGIPSGESKLLDRCCDGMLFGALKPCTTCKNGQLVYSSTMSAYVCTGNISGWTKCNFQTQTPKTVPWKLPSEFKDSPGLNNFKYKKHTRVFPNLTAPQVEETKTKESTDHGPSEVSGPKTILQKQAGIDRQKELFGGLNVVIVGRLTRSQAEISKLVSSLGGKVVTKVTAEVDLCISKKDEVAKDTGKMRDVKKEDIPVIDEEVLTWDPSSGQKPPEFEAKCISDWGKDRFKEKMEKKKTGVKRDAMSSEPSGKKVKMTVKGGSVVDPDSGLALSHHVLQLKGTTYNAVLGMVDIKRGSNSYYKLQVLEADSSNKRDYFLFRAWGRVGTTVGGNKLECYGYADEAVSEFERLYEEKTGNYFGRPFVKHPGKFYPLELDYGQDDDEITEAMEKAGQKSKLHPKVQELIKMIFDVQSMKKTMMEFEIDMQKMPLGKLSKKQMQDAYQVLTEALDEVKGSCDPVKILDCSNRFFTLIPHDFGMKKPPLLDNKEIIEEKTRMVDNLLEIEIAYSMLKDSVTSGDTDPLDVHFQKLKANIMPLDKEGEEFKMLQEYMANTHAATHSSYTLELVEVFKIEREGEPQRFKPFKKLHNHKLLWHGSRTTNYAGIISQGLRIAPPEAPVTGYMFGKGVYFADMVSKSANYCFTSHANPTGLLLLCDVALGDMYEVLRSQFITKLPAGKHSTKGCGGTHPDPTGDTLMENGVVVPKGKGTPSGVKGSSLLYNEYIVYDVAQISMKYLLKTKFHHKTKFW